VSPSGTSSSAAVVLLATELALLLLGLALVFAPLPASPVFKLIDRRRELFLSAVGVIFLGVGLDLIVLAIS